MKYPIREKPKDIQEGTINHVSLVLNAMEDAWQEREAMYLLIDLLDQLVSRHLVVTLYTAPLDSSHIESLKRDAYNSGVEAGRKSGAASARKELIARVAEVLR